MEYILTVYTNHEYAGVPTQFIINGDIEKVYRIVRKFVDDPNNHAVRVFATKHFHIIGDVYGEVIFEDSKTFFYATPLKHLSNLEIE